MWVERARERSVNVCFLPLLKAIHLFTSRKKYRMIKKSVIEKDAREKIYILLCLLPTVFIGPHLIKNLKYILTEKVE